MKTVNIPPNIPASIPPELDPLTLDETAQILRLSKPTVRKLLNSGRLKGQKLGSCWRISRQAIYEMMNAWRGEVLTDPFNCPANQRILEKMLVVKR